MATTNNVSQLPTPDTPNQVEQDSALTPGSWAHNSTTWTPVDTMTPVTTNPSRKRSRDESAMSAAGESSYFSFPSTAQQVSTPAPIPEEEPIYGEGMTLISPQTGLPLSAESQTGTWYEDKIAREEDERDRQKMAIAVAAEQAEKQFRPQMPVGRKSIRMSQSSIRSELPPVDTSAPYAPASPPKSSGDRPEVDEATIALGIGWTKVASDDVDLQAAARGWARYLENHYRGLHKVEILLKSRSLNAYLVSSQQGYFLFDDNLLQGKLVARTWDECLVNLRSQPMVFAGDEVLRAEQTPGPEIVEEPKREVMQNWSDFDRLNNRPREIVVDGSGGMDLD